MKKIYLLLIFAFSAFAAFADEEKVVVDTNVGDGVAETPSDLNLLIPVHN